MMRNLAPYPCPACAQETLNRLQEHHHASIVNDCNDLIRFCQQSDASTMMAKAHTIKSAIALAATLLECAHSELEHFGEALALLQSISTDPNAKISTGHRLLIEQLLRGDAANPINAN